MKTNGATREYILKQDTQPLQICNLHHHISISPGQQKQYFLDGLRLP